MSGDGGKFNDRTAEALSIGAAWLRRRLDESKGGWTRYEGEADISVVPTLWAFAALASTGSFPSTAWNVFRRRIVESGIVGHGLVEPAPSCAAAGWLLWTLAALREGDLMAAEDEVLLHMAAEQLADPRQLFTSESQAIVVAKDAVSGWRTWLHPAAAAVGLGSLHWLDTQEDCHSLVGRALAALMQQAAAGNDGRFHDAVLESQDGHLMFPTAYATWALAEACRRIDGRGALIRVAAVCLDSSRLLLVRQKGKRLLTLPSTVWLGGDAAAALQAHIQAQIGASVQNLMPWQTFEDRAAFEPDTNLRLSTFIGRVSDGWKVTSHGAEVVWFDVIFGDQATLSPIVRNQVLPAIRARLRFR